MKHDVQLKKKKFPDLGLRLNISRPLKASSLRGYCFPVLVPAKGVPARSRAVADGIFPNNLETKNSKIKISIMIV